MRISDWSSDVCSSDLGEALERIGGLIEFLLPRYAEEGKAYITLAFGCTGGRHRSVHIADQLGERLRRKGFSQTVVHRDMGERPDDMVEGQQPREASDRKRVVYVQSVSGRVGLGGGRI